MEVSFLSFIFPHVNFSDAMIEPGGQSELPAHKDS